MCLMKERKELAPAIDFKFAIMVAAFKSLSSKHAKWYGPEAMRVTLPTLHVIGAEDRVIKKQLSEELLPLFEGATVLSHPGGHFVPAKVHQKQSYFRFLHKVAQLRPEQPENEEEKTEVDKETTEGGAAGAKPEGERIKQETDKKADVTPSEKEVENSSTPTDENQNKEKIKTEVPTSSEAPQQIAA